MDDDGADVGEGGEPATPSSMSSPESWPDDGEQGSSLMSDDKDLPLVDNSTINKTTINKTTISVKPRLMARVCA